MYHVLEKKRKEKKRLSLCKPKIHKDANQNIYQFNKQNGTENNNIYFFELQLKC